MNRGGERSEFDRPDYTLYTYYILCKTDVSMTRNWSASLKGAHIWYHLVMFSVQAPSKIGVSILETQPYRNMFVESILCTSALAEMNSKHVATQPSRRNVGEDHLHNWIKDAPPAVEHCDVQHPVQDPLYR